MSRQRALAQLQTEGWGDRVRFFEANTATVALAAQALGCEPRRWRCARSTAPFWCWLRAT